MTWEATSPYGPLSSSYWECDGPFDCAAAPARGVGRPYDRVRHEALGHLRMTGHAVITFRGTAERFEALATEPPGGAGG